MLGSQSKVFPSVCITVSLKCFSALKMWKAAAGQSINVAVNDEGDDWETDPDFEVPASTPAPPHLQRLSPTLNLLVFL